jgi:hypothetical protein
MRFTRRRSERPVPDTGRPGSNLEALESRQLLSNASGINFYLPTDLPVRTVQHSQVNVASAHPLSSSPRQLSFLDNDGKVLTGKDRQGDEWSITVHGPGAVIVTDTSPNDGVLDDDIDTIQLVGTNVNSTYVTGQVVASARILTPGTVFFNHLVSQEGVASIILNGFTLARTAIRALGVDNLKVSGSAWNLTVARRAVPFANGFSGISHLGTATFGGNADAVGLDVAGKIGKLQFLKGLGNPTGTSPSATTFGTPIADLGYPANGFLGGLVTAKQIGSVTVGPANSIFQTANDPDFIQLYRQGSTNYFTRLGTALTNSAIVSSGSIGKTNVVGNSQNSEIKAGYHYPSFVAGLEPTRAPSKVGPVRYRGDLVDSAISATYRPVSRVYGQPPNIAGPGKIRGNFQGVLVNTGQSTPLVNTGAGFYARTKVGYLPPPSKPRRVNGVLTVV